MTAASNQFPRWNDQLVIRFLKDKLEDEDDGLKAKVTHKPKPKPTRRKPPINIEPVHDISDTLPPAHEQVERIKPDPPERDTNDVEPSHNILDPSKALKAYKMLRDASHEEEASSKQSYNILRSLPGYTIGDKLRKQEKVLCYSKEATSYAMTKLRPGDCSFIIRSDGSFTYAIYEGIFKGDSTTMSFQVDNIGQGHFKRIPIASFCKLVKVPVLFALGGPPTIPRRSGNRRASTSMPSNMSRNTGIVSRSRSRRDGRIILP